MFNLGYEEAESRMALRATYGDIAQAVDWILRKREEQTAIKIQEKENLTRRKLQKKLGSCSNGVPVSIQLFHQLKQMGYSPTLIAESLKRSNNDLNTAIQLMADNEFSKKMVAEAITATAAEIPTTSSSVVGNSEIAAALQSAAQLITSSSSQDINNEVLLAARAALDSFFSEEQLMASKIRSDEELMKAQQAYDTLAKDTCSEAEYIDLNLSAEYEYLELYKSHLLSMKR